MSDDAQVTLDRLIKRRGGLPCFSDAQITAARVYVKLQLALLLDAAPGELARIAGAMAQMEADLPPVVEEKPPEPDFSSMYAGLSSQEVGELMDPFFLDMSDDPTCLRLKRACALARVVAARIPGEPSIATALRDAISRAARMVRDRLVLIAQTDDVRGLAAVDRMSDELDAGTAAFFEPAPGAADMSQVEATNAYIRAVTGPDSAPDASPPPRGAPEPAQARQAPPYRPEPPGAHTGGFPRDAGPIAAEPEPEPAVTSDVVARRNWSRSTAKWS